MGEDDASGAMGGFHDAGGSGGDIEARMESTDGDSGTSALQSMGYIENGSGANRGETDATGSWTSTLKTAITILVGVFLGILLLYLLVSSILFMFGVFL